MSICLLNDRKRFRWTSSLHIHQQPHLHLRCFPQHPVGRPCQPHPAQFPVHLHHHSSQEKPLSAWTAATSALFLNDLPLIVPSSSLCLASSDQRKWHIFRRCFLAWQWCRTAVWKADCQKGFLGWGSANYDLGKQSWRQWSEQVEHIITSCVCTL